MDIAVIGAGLSGLTCARLLSDAGAKVAVFEAASRIGGRIHALRDERGQALADLGPTWVWPPHQPVVAQWLERLGIATFAQANDGDAVIEGYHPAPIRAPLPGQDGMARIKGGPAALVQAMAADLPDGTLHLNRPITRITLAPDGLILTDATGAQIIAAKVVLSTPLRVAAAQIAIPDAPAAVLDAMRATPTWMAGQAKAVILYDRPFWRNMGLSGRIASRIGPLTEMHDHSAANGQPALFGFVGWPPEARDPAALDTAIRAQLTRCFGPSAPQPRSITVQDWSRNPLICTAADHAGAHPDLPPAILRQTHLQGRLHIAIAEVSTRSPGLIEGALDAGETAAATLLASATTDWGL
ncbi:MAG: amine oxidase [Rhodobacterales bacterium 34-62-10]|nr:MAG: amine oxidase [Rhodobacterales bacterium 34-62-10]